MAPIIINRNKNFAYRISHVHNLPHILQAGLCTKRHPHANPHFISIGNPSIINTRDTTPVKITGYGNIGDYVPFYFTPRSIMLYNSNRLLCSPCPDSATRRYTSYKVPYKNTCYSTSIFLY